MVEMSLKKYCTPVKKFVEFSMNYTTNAKQKWILCAYLNVHCCVCMVRFRLLYGGTYAHSRHPNNIFIASNVD